MSKFEPNKRHLREVLIFCFKWKKTAAEAHRMLVEVYGDSAPSDKTCREWFRRFKSGDFDVEDKERSGRPRAFEDEELQALVDEDPCQTQKQLAEALNCAQSVISDRLKALGKVYKEGKYMNWSQETLKGEKPSAKFCLLGNKERGFCIVSSLGMKNGFILTTPNVEKPFATPANPQHRRQSGISTERRQCSVFGGIRRV